MLDSLHRFIDSWIHLRDLVRSKQVGITALLYSTFRTSFYREFHRGVPKHMADVSTCRIQ